MTDERDTQRAKLYRSEQALVPFSKPLPSTKDVTRYLVRQSTRATLVRRYGSAVDMTKRPVTVKDGRGRLSACAWGGYAISIPLWARNDRVVLHEWAHVIHSRLAFRCQDAERVAELRGGAAHGWQFAAIYLDLVHFCMGAEAADALKASYRACHVRFRPKQKRVATPEQIARLAACRPPRGTA